MASLDHILDRLCYSTGGPARWAATRTMSELTAQRLEGRVASQPGYYGTVDVDENNAPGLTSTPATSNTSVTASTGFPEP
jgi:hypothetical protein